MIVEVPFHYAAVVVPKGKRKAVEVHLASSVAVDVAGATAEEAPVVLRWHRRTSPATRARWPMPKRSLIRWSRRCAIR